MRALGFATVMSTRFVMDGALVASVVLLAFSRGKLLNEIGRKANVRSTLRENCV